MKEYWTVDPEAQTVELYRLAPGGYELTRTFRHDGALASPLLPGFAPPVGSIFQS